MVDPAGPSEPAPPPGDRDEQSAAVPPAPGPPAPAPASELAAAVPPAPGPPPAELPPGPLAADPAPPYALPTARKVVASGLQLALASTADLRRASIYIGLLVLGSFGPAIIAVLLIVGRLGDQAGDVLGNVFLNGEFGAPPEPALEAALLVVAIEALVGIAMFLTISIDAQIMGIAILGGRAGERPLRLWEAVIRARQAFWRVAGAGAIVGLVTAIVQGFIATVLGGYSRSVDAASIVAGLVATIVVAPLAYVGTSIVLGDVGAMESLSRSWRLFQARRLLAVVVVLFTFVTSAIQLFALSAGLDLVVRAADLLHVSLTEGVVAFGIAIVLILAAVVAYGSLTFTIGAIVAAPQVTGFLGMTFFAGGLDRARVDGPAPPRGFHLISRPMAVAMIALAGVVGLEIPAINSIVVPTPAPTAAFLREEGSARAWVLSTVGHLDPSVDPAGDAGQIGAPPGSPAPGPAAIADVVLADYAFVPYVPEWLLEETFACDAPSVTCGELDLLTSSFADGAFLFLLRVAGDTADVSTCAPCRFGAFMALGNEPRAPSDDELFPDASHAYIATLDGSDRSVKIHRWYLDQDTPFDTRARVLRRGSEVLLLIPSEELPANPVTWNVFTSARRSRVTASDRLGTATRRMLPWAEYVPDLWLDPPGGALEP